MHLVFCISSGPNRPLYLQKPTLTANVCEDIKFASDCIWICLLFSPNYLLFNYTILIHNSTENLSENTKESNHYYCSTRWLILFKYLACIEKQTLLEYPWWMDGWIKNKLGLALILGSLLYAQKREYLYI